MRSRCGVDYVAIRQGGQQLHGLNAAGAAQRMRSLDGLGRKKQCGLDADHAVWAVHDPERKRLMHAGGFFCELVKYVTRSQQSPFDDPNLAAFSKESDKEGASIDFRSGRLEKNKGI